MKLKSILVFLCYFYASCVSATKNVTEAQGCMMCHRNPQSVAQQKPSTLTKNHSLTRLKQHVQFLTDEAREGRMAGSIGEQEAVAYVAAYFNELHLETYEHSPSFLQPFELNISSKKKQLEPAMF